MLELIMEINNLDYDEYSYLINRSYVKYFNKNMLPVIVAWGAFFLFSYAIFNSSNNVYYVSGVTLSLHYIPPFLLSVYAATYSTYRIFFVCYTRVIKEVAFFQGDTVICKLNGDELKLSNFSVILDQKKLMFKNIGAYGITKSKEDEFQYVGLRENSSSKNKIYLIPCMDSSKEELVKLLLNHGGSLAN